MVETEAVKIVDIATEACSARLGFFLVHRWFFAKRLSQNHLKSKYQLLFTWFDLTLVCVLAA
jgi:hypothetical protein